MFFFKQKAVNKMRISDWSSDVCSADLASPADQPVEISLCAPGREAQIVIADRGGGMSASFIRDQLFKPFVSTKTGGFGIGAFESREIVRAVGGSLDVWSREWEGTRCTVHLPLARSEEHTSDLQPLMSSS